MKIKDIKYIQFHQVQSFSQSNFSISKRPDVEFEIKFKTMSIFQLVAPSEVGKAFSMLGVGGDFAYLTASAVYALTYRYSVDFEPGVSLRSLIHYLSNNRLVIHSAHRLFLHKVSEFRFSS